MMKAKKGKKRKTRKEKVKGTKRKQQQVGCAIDPKFKSKLMIDF